MIIIIIYANFAGKCRAYKQKFFVSGGHIFEFTAVTWLLCSITFLWF